MTRRLRIGALVGSAVAALAALGVAAAVGVVRVPLLHGSDDVPADARQAAEQPGLAHRGDGNDPRRRVPLPSSLGDASTATQAARANGRGAVFGETNPGGGAATISKSTAGARPFGSTARTGASADGGAKASRPGRPARKTRARRSANPGTASSTTTPPPLADTSAPERETGTTTDPTPPPPPLEPPPPPPPPGPLEISNVRLLATTPFTATISWRSNLPGRGQVVFGPDLPIVWSEGDEGTEHKITIGGLAQSTNYEFRVVSWDAWDRKEQSGIGRFTTPRLTESPTATVRGDTILLNGQPYFPTMVWERCDVPRELMPFGIDLFMGCPVDRSVAWRLGHDAYTLSPAGDTVPHGAVIGRYLPDEWDTFLPGDLTVGDVTRLIPPKEGNELDFLGLTNHFYSYAAPLPQGRGMYPALMQKADILGFNLYPLQIWCRDNAFHHVYHSQRELHTLSGGKPTFQWIEANLMERECGHEPHLWVTDQTVRAEAWLSVAGGADGVGYFPHGWNRSVAAEIRRTNNQLKALAPALLSPEAPVAAADVALRVGARSAHGALYVVAVNVTRQPVASAEITLPGLEGRPLSVYHENRTVESSGDAFRDAFGPLEVHLYVVEPSA